MKTRFCPSPTGSMHIGNARTALFSALYAASHQGRFLLRIEDTDKERSDPRYEEQILSDLRWLGIDWQEGPDKDLGNGPYRQSARQEIYDRYYEKLVKVGMAYPCFCSERELAIARKTQLASGKPPRYMGKCALLSKAEIAEKLKSGLKPTLRFRIPSGEMLEFIDLVKGVQRFNTDDIGDFIIRRTNGSSPFMFCNAIDDALMGVTHVIRGEDHVTNTPRQILILKTLGLDVPEYGHISLIVGHDGAPLSKRHGSSSVADFRANGILPAALINYLARLGHYYEDNSFMSFNELADKFKAKSLAKSPAKFDTVQLAHWQKEAILRMDSAVLWQWMGESVHHLVPEKRQAEFVKAVSPNILSPDDAFYWAEILFNDLKLHDASFRVLKKAGKQFYETALNALKEHGADFQLLSSTLQEALNVKGKQLFMPLRVALTGEMHGPELVHIFNLLSLEFLEKRFNDAKNLC